MSDVTMTAYNEATEPDRIERLGRVSKALQRKRRIRLTGSIMSEPTPRIGTAIRALHDHKGILYVDWEEQPTTQEMSAVSRAWLRENEHDVNHYVRGRELVCDVGSHNPFRPDVAAA